MRTLATRGLNDVIAREFDPGADHLYQVLMDFERSTLCAYQKWNISFIVAGVQACPPPPEIVNLRVVCPLALFL